MKVLNLYSGIGGNRKLWQNVEVTAVELNEEIAAIYKEYFPNDTVIIADAHEYLLKHYKDFDFIWSSPPCPSHSKIRAMASARGDYEPIFPDMKLWQEITFLNWFASEKKFVVENVIPYYEPYIKPTIQLERHCFWSNFYIKKTELEKVERDHKYIKPSDNLYGFDLKDYSLKSRKVQLLRNCVNPDLGLYILEQAQGIIRQEQIKQQTLFQ
jgi:DNA (cytosine-5)-methyltransferase 1